MVPAEPLESLIFSFSRCNYLVLSAFDRLTEKVNIEVLINLPRVVTFNSDTHVVQLGISVEHLLLFHLLSLGRQAVKVQTERFVFDKVDEDVSEVP